MSRFKSRLARHECCETVMPVPVLRVALFSSEAPKPIHELKDQLFPYHQDEFQPTIVPIEFYSYPPPSVPPAGTFLQMEKGPIPLGYVLCDGREVSRETFAPIFYVIGTYYGAGNNVDTFNLPNLVNDSNPSVVYIMKT